MPFPPPPLPPPPLWWTEERAPTASPPATAELRGECSRRRARTPSSGRANAAAQRAQEPAVRSAQGPARGSEEDDRELAAAAARSPQARKMPPAQGPELVAGKRSTAQRRERIAGGSGGADMVRHWPCFPFTPAPPSTPPPPAPCAVLSQADRWGGDPPALSLGI